MKKILFSILFLLISAGFFLLYPKIASLFQKETVYIAVAGPMQAGEGGQDMLRGIRLCLEQLKTEKKITDKNVELLIFDDKNDEQTAIRIASEISADNRIVLVLGHYYSSPSIAAGEIYKKNGVPAITATASSDSVTLGNEWYFRVIPPNGYEGGFIANYLKQLGKSAVSIVFIRNSYGTNLSDNFEKTAAEIGLSVKRKWGIEPNSRTLSEDLEKIGAELRAEGDPGTIFFATYETEGMKIIASFNYPGTPYSIIGADAFSSVSFSEAFNIYPQERIRPGYYSDGIYALSPFMAAIGNEKSQAFNENFMKTYGYEPTWEPACYYDAMRVAMETIERAEIDSKDSARKNRKKIRDALAEFSSPDVSVKGITGNIYFDENRNFIRPMAVGIFQLQKLLPAFVQFHPINSLKSDMSKNTDKTFIINNSLMTLTNIVYTGIDINEISHIDKSKSTCTVDFYLWFRFQADFDAKSLIFMNAVTPIELGKPILEESDRGVTTQTYHIKADFRFDSYLKAYPFDHRSVSVAFRHADKTRNSLIFIPDTLGLPRLGSNVDKRLNVNGWNIKRSNCYQKIVNVITNGQSSEYSQFIASAQVERKGIGFAVKTLFPFFIIPIVLFLVYGIPADRIGDRMLVCIAGIISCGIFHAVIWSDSRSLPYTLAIEYVCFAIYGLSATGGLISSAAYILRGSANKCRLLNLAGKIIHSLAMILIGIFIGILYHGH
jgi:branched-chain amino acid transport system substrate-binding protein